MLKDSGKYAAGSEILSKKARKQKRREEEDNFFYDNLDVEMKL